MTTAELQQPAGGVSSAEVLGLPREDRSRPEGESGKSELEHTHAVCGVRFLRCDVIVTMTAATQHACSAS